MAGLRAAQILRCDGKLTILVLEARDSAGGRIRWTSVPSSSSSSSSSTGERGGNSLYVDEGAQFIHGSNNGRHPLVKLAKQAGIATRKMDWDDGYSLTGPHGQELSSAIERKQEKVVGKLLKQLEQWQDQQERNRKLLAKQQQQQPHEDASLQDVLEPWIDECCRKDTTLSATRIRTALKMQICDDYAADLHALSANYFDRDEELGGTDAVPHTYQRMVEAVLQPVHDIVRYQHVVQEISFATGGAATDDLVKITCRHAESGEQVQVSARRVICTLPLGVLKQQASTLFQPSLPEPLPQCMERLGFGCLEKIWLSFDNKATTTPPPPFWPTDADAFYHFGAETPYRVWFVPARVYKDIAYRHVLCCFVSGDAARALAHKTTDQVATEALAALAQIIDVPGGSNTNEDAASTRTPSILKHVHVTKWSTDPWSGHGSYSHVAVGSTPADMRVFERAFYQDRLWFAGEATNAQYPGTVHGAYLSGERAARACLQSLK